MKKMTLAALTLSFAFLAPVALVLGDTTPAATTTPAAPTAKPKTHKSHKKGMKKASAPTSATTPVTK